MRVGVFFEREIDMEEFQSIGSEIVDLERSFNNKRGFDSSDDVLPEGVTVPNLEAELQEYYSLRGWTDNGRVRSRK